MNITIDGLTFPLLHPRKLTPWKVMQRKGYGHSPLSPRRDMAIQGEPVSQDTAWGYYQACHAYAKGGPAWERWQREHPQ